MAASRLQTHTIRPATHADLDGVAAIYADEVRLGTATFDTEPPPRSRWESMLASGWPSDHFLVAVDSSEVVVGYAYSGVYRPRGAYLGTREVSIYLAPTATGRGLGRRLYEDLLRRVEAGGAHTVLAGVALPNPASLALHRACGFEHVGIMREVGFKQDRWIDVSWWQKRFGIR
ncbi:GNAT family N-acetyltransferase [Pseudactinotalea terrae]|uniref:GNAT family N-acetyltransferase n=1 Tax=Pseudactinotalea terrae TaxID=1743262 RepID=UPI0013909949|nr:GNAT family N-acetyltransferase [Pseudactinotalea terrae]